MSKPSTADRSAPNNDPGRANVDPSKAAGQPQRSTLPTPEDPRREQLIQLLASLLIRELIRQQAEKTRENSNTAATVQR